nr:unnamed protein product [Leishmania braziliensis]
MYHCARASAAAMTVAPAKDNASPMWTEAPCLSHLFVIPLLFVQPMRLYAEFVLMEAGSQLRVALGCVTQAMCIAAFHVVNDKISACPLNLKLTLRKLAGFVLSIVYVVHYRHLSTVEWVSRVDVLMEGTAYSFLPKAHHHASYTVNASAAPEAWAKKSR